MLFSMVILTNVGSVFAGNTETLDLTAQGYANTDEVSKVEGSYFTVEFNKGSNQNQPKYYTSGNAVRVYGGCTFTVSSELTFSKVELTFGSGDGGESGSNPITTNAVTYADGTWQGTSTKSVTFTIGGTSGHRRIQKVTVTFDSELPSVEPSPTETETPTAPTYETPEEIVDAAFELAKGEQLSGGPYTLTGIVSKVNTQYTSNNNFITVTFAIPERPDNSIQCYKLVDSATIDYQDGIEAVAVGDTITVKGEIKNYNGTVQFNQGSTLEARSSSVTYESPEAIVTATYALQKNNEALPGGPFTLTGKVTSIDTSYNSTYKNITVTIQIGELSDKKIQCYRLKNGDNASEENDVSKIAVDDIITVKGNLTKYNTVFEFRDDCKLINRVYGGHVPVHYETTEEILAAAAELQEGETLEGGEYELTGTVTRIVEDYNTEYKNITFIMDVDGVEIEGYHIKNGDTFVNGDGVEILSPRDTVTIKGEIHKYSGVIEFKSGSTLKAMEHSARIFSASLSLTENLDINFKVKANQFDSENEEAVIRVVFNGKTTDITGELDEEESKFIFTFENITPALMADEMTVSLLIDGEVTDEITYSIAEYCYNLLRQTDSAALKTLLVDLLIYGAKSQLYINHNVDNLADKGLTEDELDFATPDEDLPKLNKLTDFVGLQDDPVYTIKSVGLNLTDGIIIRLKFVVNEGCEASEAAALVVGEAFEGSLEETSVPGTYYAFFKIDNPTFFSEGYQMYAANQGALAPGLSNILYTSAESYCASILEKCADGRITDQALQDIVTALVKYAYSVKAYVG